MIQIQDVSFEYEKEQGTLSHIDLNIQQGECGRMVPGLVWTLYR